MGEALGFIAIGLVVGFIGRHFQAQYFRDFHNPDREDKDPVYAQNAVLMRRGAAIFLTTGAMMVIVGVYFLIFG
jgi:hypothetical protein